MKQIFTFFTDTTTVNQFSELTKGQLHLFALWITISAIIIISKIIKAPKYENN